MLRGLLAPGRCAERCHHRGLIGTSTAAYGPAEPAAYLTSRPSRGGCYDSLSRTNGSVDAGGAATGCLMNELGRAARVRCDDLKRRPFKPWHHLSPVRRRVESGSLYRWLHPTRLSPELDDAERRFLRWGIIEWSGAMH